MWSRAWSADSGVVVWVSKCGSIMTERVPKLEQSCISQAGVMRRIVDSISGSMVPDPKAGWFNDGVCGRMTKMKEF